MAKDMDEFLAVEGEVLPPEGAQEGEGAPVVEAKPEPEAKPETKPEPKVEADHEEPIAEDVAGLRNALVAERAKRRDYKGERDKLDGELTALRTELEAVRKAPPPPPPAPVAESKPAAATPRQIAVPNPAEDPQGYHDFQMRWQEEQRFNDRTKISERLLTKEIGKEEVARVGAEFRAAAEKNPALWEQVKEHPLPYEFAYEVVKRVAALAEVGDDPAAWRTSERARMKAELEAELAGGLGVPKPQAPEVVLPGSLATARSAAPRSQAAATDEMPFEEIFAKRKRA